MKEHLFSFKYVTWQLKFVMIMTCDVYIITSPYRLNAQISSDRLAMLKP